MPRQARIDAPGALHHIICRGIERKRIFHDDQDRNNFLERLGSILLDTSTTCFAWALIPNHFHLLLRTGSIPIATVMRRLLTGYAVSFNQRHRRHGQLFQNRYKSILCEEVSGQTLPAQGRHFYKRYNQDAMRCTVNIGPRKITARFVTTVTACLQRRSRNI